ncbi:MAG: hypothetical protein ACI8UR_001698 [Natronomonas sp.]|jgi:hypothetical protein|uniref:hypothetical protein n=1 Tax=Natronomonas sp. TaxID=2184060 RepID=UPI0039898093
MLDVNWTGPRPPRNTIERVWSSATFETVDPDTESVEAYVDAMAETRTQGDARWCCVEIPDSPVLDWFAGRNCLADADFFANLLGSEPVAAALGLDPDDPAPTFTTETALSLDGVLAEQLVHGGSTSFGDTIDQQYGTFASAKNLAEACRHDIVEDRYEEVTVHRTREPWADWFGEPHWNVTLVAVDRRYRWAWVFVATDEGLVESARQQAASL